MRGNELDLHALTVGQALEVFVREYNRAVRAGDYGEMVVVHGYGSSGQGGEIRTRLRQMLQGCADALAFEPGERWGGNPGVTVIYPRGPIPSLAEQIAGEILAYCTQPKPQDKIVGKFVTYGEMTVLAALRDLEKKGRLKRTYKGKHKAYVAA